MLDTYTHTHQQTESTANYNNSNLAFVRRGQTKAPKIESIYCPKQQKMSKVAQLTISESLVFDVEIVVTKSPLSYGKFGIFAYVRVCVEHTVFVMYMHAKICI